MGSYVGEAVGGLGTSAARKMRLYAPYSPNTSRGDGEGGQVSPSHVIPLHTYVTYLEGPHPSQFVVGAMKLFS